MITLSNKLATELGLTIEVLDLIMADDWIKVPVQDSRPEDQWGVRATQTCARCECRMDDPLTIDQVTRQDETGLCQDCMDGGPE